MAAPSYTFDDRALRYRHSGTGRFVSEAAIQEAMQQVIEAEAQRLLAMSGRLIAGTINLPTWQTAMVEGIRTIHTVGAGLAAGGFARLDAQTIQRAEDLVRVQLAFLQRFALQVQTGEQPLNGVFERRVQMYVEAANTTVQEIRRDQADQAGYDQERRKLGIADHCRDCLKAARRGWQPIGTLPRIGESECRTNCQCVFDFRKRAAERAA